MKFSTREDIEAPINVVFTRVVDFAAFERQALRRGADVRRLDQATPPHIGSSWDVAFEFRGKNRKMNARVIALDVPNLMQVGTTANGLESVAEVELVALAPNRTRIAVSIDLSAKSIAARLLLQSLKLAKSNLTKRFKQRVGDYAQNIEDDYRKGNMNS